ncbi:unnamed protein product [Pylaiella littoralis]
MCRLVRIDGWQHMHTNTHVITRKEVPPQSLALLPRTHVLLLSSPHRTQFLPPYDMIPRTFIYLAAIPLRDSCPTVFLTPSPRSLGCFLCNAVPWSFRSNTTPELMPPTAYFISTA